MISAPAEGVGARRSETKSAIVKSTEVQTKSSTAICRWRSKGESRMKKTIMVLGVIFISLSGFSSFAAQTAKVVVGSANLLDKPQAGGSVLGTVAQDTSISVSNAATNGFYKSRIPSGVVGWISESDILTGAAPAAKPEPIAQNKRTEKTEKRRRI